MNLFINFWDAFKTTEEYAPNWAEENFVISKSKNTVPWTYVINDLNDEEFAASFMKKNNRIQIKKNLE